MEFRTPISGIRPNPAGDWPTIDETAFVDPTTPADAAPRESIEVRTLVFHRQ